ncbi:MAG: hypothetical protein IPO60_08120 [Flavobacteriales bacterium]|nr:hypothetical protein [Flavobacteriales bacterium]
MKIFYPALLLVSCSANAQYSGPESVEHDAEGQRYFVSNTGDNSIKQRAYDGTVTAFASNLPTAPYGIELKGDTLFACMGGSIRGFSTVDGVVVFSLSVGGSFLNGITTDGAFLYATDFSTKKIFQVNVGATDMHHTGGQYQEHAERDRKGSRFGAPVGGGMGQQCQDQKL